MHLLFSTPVRVRKRNGETSYYLSRDIHSSHSVGFCFRVGWDLNQRIFIGSHILKAALREAG